MKKNILNIVKYLIFTGVAVLLLYLVFRDQDLHKIGNNLMKANYYWVVLSLLLSLLSYVFRAYRWNLLIEPLGFKPSLLNSLSAVSIGYFANIAVPRIGEVSRCGALNKTDKIPVDKLFATVIIERSFDLISLVILMGLLLTFKFSFFGGFFETSVINPLYQKFNIQHISWIVIISVILFLISLIVLIFYFRNSLLKVKVVSAAFKFGKGIIEGILSVRHMKRPFSFLVFTALIWITYLMMAYVVFFSIPATRNLSIIDALFIMVAGGLGQVAPVQNGFGVFHGIVASALMLYGISFDDGLLYAIIGHESSTLFMILIGLLAMFYTFIYKRKNGLS